MSSKNPLEAFVFNPEHKQTPGLTHTGIIMITSTSEGFQTSSILRLLNPKHKRSLGLLYTRIVVITF